MSLKAEHFQTQQQTTIEQILETRELISLESGFIRLPKDIHEQSCEANYNETSDVLEVSVRNCKFLLANMSIYEVDELLLKIELNVDFGERRYIYLVFESNSNEDSIVEYIGGIQLTNSKNSGAHALLLFEVTKNQNGIVEIKSKVGIANIYSSPQIWSSCKDGCKTILNLIASLLKKLDSPSEQTLQNKLPIALSILEGVFKDFSNKSTTPELLFSRIELVNVIIQKDPSDKEESSKILSPLYIKDFVRELGAYVTLVCGESVVIKLSKAAEYMREDPTRNFIEFELPDEQFSEHVIEFEGRSLAEKGYLGGYLSFDGIDPVSRNTLQHQNVDNVVPLHFDSFIEENKKTIVRSRETLNLLQGKGKRIVRLYQYGFERLGINENTVLALSPK